MAKTATRVETIKHEAVRTAYAAAGATDLAVEVARGYVSEAQKRVDAVRKQVTDPKGVTTRYTTNAFGEVMSEISPDIGTISYQRDANGEVTRIEDARGQITNIECRNPMRSRFGQWLPR